MSGTSRPPRPQRRPYDADQIEASWSITGTLIIIAAVAILFWELFR